jgi:bifunctional non-homologous end joining protein LigD
LETSRDETLRVAREMGLEGVVANRRDGRYEAGKRSGSWAKFRVNSGQELLIGGYIPGSQGVDSIILSRRPATMLALLLEVGDVECSALAASPSEFHAIRRNLTLVADKVRSAGDQ